jgi:hypothetical protein
MLCLTLVSMRLHFFASILYADQLRASAPHPLWKCGALLLISLLIPFKSTTHFLKKCGAIPRDMVPGLGLARVFGKRVALP